MQVTAGVPQGSVLEPTLWNIFYEGVLRLELTEGARTIGFADDLALLVQASDMDELTFRTDDSLRRIGVWMEFHQLELAPHKTEAVVLKGPRRREGVACRLKDIEIRPKRAVKYLGVLLDDNGSFGEHIKWVANKAEERAATLSRIMPNIGGPSSKKREVLCAVV